MLVRLSIGGLIAVAVILLGLAPEILSTRAATLQAKTPPITIEVIGHQWWWEVRYHSDQPSLNFTTANELRIPVDRKVRLRLRSADVIHSFWVPALAGKTDMIPGRVNEMWIAANRVGEFRGQCAEFCGQQHAFMALRVIAQTPKDFETWWSSQLQPAPPIDEAESPDAQAGGRLFVAKCGICHTVRGTLAGGKIGPDLSHLMTRGTLAAATLPNTPTDLAIWIAAPQRIKPHNKMPNPELTATEHQLIWEYLQTLE